jgi:hypothetical protein
MWPPESIKRALLKLVDAGFLVSHCYTPAGDLQRIDLCQYFPLSDKIRRQLRVTATVHWYVSTKAEMVSLLSDINQSKHNWLAWTSWRDKFVEELKLCVDADRPSYRLCMDTLLDLEREGRNTNSPLLQFCSEESMQYVGCCARLHYTMLTQRVDAALGLPIESTDVEPEELFKRTHGVKDIHTGDGRLEEVTELMVFIRSLDAIVRRMSAQQIRWEERMTSRSCS